MMAGNIPRAKVPVKDGKSQKKFMEETAKIKAITVNADQTFYTAEEVAKHKKDDDCWTVY